MYLFRLALASLANRRFTALLTVFAIALSVCLLLAVERVRTEARASFASTISGTDLIVGARSGSVNLLLYSVFRIGNATNNIRWDSFETLAHNPKVKWAIPISLGDSHKGYRVMGTSEAYFDHYRYGRAQALKLAEGKPFSDMFDVVLGAEVAEALKYKLGDKVVLSTASPPSAWCSTTTSPSPWSASSNAPVRRWTAPCTSPSRGWRHCTSTGRTACPRAVPARSTPTRPGPWTCNPRPSPPSCSASTARSPPSPCGGKSTSSVANRCWRSSPASPCRSSGA